MKPDRQYSKTCKACDISFQSNKPQQKKCENCLEQSLNLAKCSQGCGAVASHNRTSKKEYVCQNCSKSLRLRSCRLMEYIANTVIHRAGTTLVIDSVEDVIHLLNLYQNMHIANGFVYNHKNDSRKFLYNICHRSPVSGHNRIGKSNRANTFIGQSSVNKKNGNKKIVLADDDNSIEVINIKAINSLEDRLGKIEFNYLLDILGQVQDSHKEYHKKVQEGFELMIIDGAEYSCLDSDQTVLKPYTVIAKTLYALKNRQVVEHKENEMIYKYNKKPWNLSQVMGLNIKLQGGGVIKAYENIVIDNELALKIQNVFFTAEQGGLYAELISLAENR